LKHRDTEGTEKEERAGGGDREWEMRRGKDIERGKSGLDWRGLEDGSRRATLVRQ
jgi:hypothetical protein